MRARSSLPIKSCTRNVSMSLAFSSQSLAFSASMSFLESSGERVRVLPPLAIGTIVVP